MKKLSMALAVALSFTGLPVLGNGHATYSQQHSDIEKAYAAFKSRYLAEDGRIGFANKISVFCGLPYLEMMCESNLCAKHLELTAEQLGKLRNKTILDISAKGNGNFLEPLIGERLVDILDLSQQAKLAAVIVSEEGLLGLRYRFIDESFCGLSPEKKKQFDRLVDRYFDGEPMRYLEVLTPIPKDEDAAAGRKKLLSHAREFDEKVWKEILDDRQCKRLGRLPPVPKDFREKCLTEMAEKKD